MEEENDAEINSLDNDEKGFLTINPEKAIKNIKTIVVWFVVIAFSIALVIQLTVNKSTDLWNATTLSVEIIFGVFISLVVYIYSKRMNEKNKRQQKNLSKLIKNITQIEQKQQKIIDFQESFLKRNSMYYTNVYRSSLTEFLTVVLSEEIKLLKAKKSRKSKITLLSIAEETNKKLEKDISKIQLISIISANFLEPAVITNVNELIIEFYDRKEIISKNNTSEIIEYYDKLVGYLEHYVKMLPTHIERIIFPKEIKKIVQEMNIKSN